MKDDEIRALLDGATPEPDAIIPDEDVIRVHGYANFGSMTPRDVIADGVLKYALGYQSGHTQLMILLEHKLVRKPKPGSYRSTLTKRGQAYLRAAWPFRLIAAAPDLAAECLRRGEELARVTERAEKAEALLAEAVEALRPFAIEHAWDGVTRFEIVLAGQTGSIKGADLDLALATLAKLEARHD